MDIPKPDVVITRQWNRLFVKFRRQNPCFRGRRVQRTYQQHCPSLITNRKWKCTLSDRKSIWMTCADVCKLKFYTDKINVLKSWYLTSNTSLLAHLMCSRCFTHLFSQPAYINSQQQLLQSVGVHLYFRLVISLGQCRRYVHWTRRPRKHGIWRWNFTNDPIHCLVITTSGLGMSISISD